MNTNDNGRDCAVRELTDNELDAVDGGFALPGLGWAIELIGRGLQTAFKGQNSQPGRVDVFGSRPL